MALAAGDKVYLDIGGILQDSPLFGVVDLTGQPTPDVIRVNWENGVQTTYSAEATSGLVERGVDTNEIRELGKVYAFNNQRMKGLVIRSFFRDPEGGNVRTMLLLVELAERPGSVARAHYVLVPFSQLSPV